MSNTITRLFVLGFPSLYGGAGTELHHQIIIWREMGIDVHLIPSYAGVETDPLYLEMCTLGVTVHAARDWSVIHDGDPVFGFCNSEFLESLPEIRKRTKRTVFVNCMTWLFEKEKEAMTRGDIAMFLYQNDTVRQSHEPQLRALNDEVECRFMHFKPYFHAEHFPYIEQRSTDIFGCGRISRQDADKFASNTLRIYDYFVAPVMKRGLFLGFGAKSEEKIGRPYDWIMAAMDQHSISQQDFYKHCRIILQPSDTTENWPRIGFEAMSSGSVLIVDDRGGWQQMIEHGKTGWLCRDERDFIYYASKMAYEPNMRDDMAAAARERMLQLGGHAASVASWQEVLTTLAELPA